MRIRSFLSSLLIAALTAGCGTAPELPSETELKVAEVVERVKCELHDIVARYPQHHSWLLKWAAGFTLTLKVKSRGGGEASTNFIWPISLGTSTVALNGGVTADAIRIAIFKLSITLADAKIYRCPLIEPEGVSRSNLTGDLGLAEWMGRTIEAVEASHSEKDFNGVGHTLEFFLQTTGGVSPSWALVRNITHKYNPLVKVNLQRENTNTLDIALTRIPGVQHVIVDNLFPMTTYRDDGGGGREPVVKSHQGVDQDTQQRLDRILQDLQLRNLQLDR